MLSNEMKIIYEDPKDILYHRWVDNDGPHDMWYKNSIYIADDYKDMDIPRELAEFLDKWTLKIEEYKKSYAELYPVKNTRITFIYQEYVYEITPITLSATYRTNFMSDEYYDAPWHSLFEEYQRDIRDSLKAELGVKYSRYIGFLD